MYVVTMSAQVSNFSILFSAFFQQKLVQYREAVINMCSAFEDGLSQFIRSFAPNQVKEGNPDLHQAEKKVDNTSKHKRHRRVTKAQHSVRDDGNQKDVQMDQMEGEADPRDNAVKSKKRKPDDRIIAAGRPKKKKMKVSAVSEDCHVEGPAVFSEEKASDGQSVDITRNMFAEEKASDGQSVDITCNMFAEDDQTLNKEPAKLYEEDGTDEGNVNLEELVQASEEVLPIVPVETEVSLPHTNTVDALRILQGYGTGSQSSTETPQVHITGEGMQVEQEDERSNGSAQLKTKTSKSVSFSDQG
jgi:hypothetical protein